MEQNEIDNVREWMKAKYPAEWQTDRIPEKLTFGWLAANIHRRAEWEQHLDELDTAPREAVLAEAAKRIIRGLRDAGFARQAIEEAIQDTRGWA